MVLDKKVFFKKLHLENLLLACMALISNRIEPFEQKLEKGHIRIISDILGQNLAIGLYVL